MRHIARGRLIPARAGNISRAPTSYRPRAAHPRSRGEHDIIAASIGAILGSSPLARGTLANGEDAPRRVRLIPARAGNIVLQGARDGLS